MPTFITAKQYELLKKNFRNMDRQGLGFINHSQFDDVLFLSGVKLLDAELRELTQKTDPEGKEEITFERLIICLNLKNMIDAEIRKNKRDKLMTSFKKLDRYNCGSLSEKDLVSATRLSGIKVNKYLMSDAIETAKLMTSNGLIRYRELIEKVLNE